MTRDQFQLIIRHSHPGMRRWQAFNGEVAEHDPKLAALLTAEDEAHDAVYAYLKERRAEMSPADGKEIPSTAQGARPAEKKP